MPLIFAAGAALDVLLAAVNLALWLDSRSPLSLYAAVLCAALAIASGALAVWFLRCAPRPARNNNNN